MIICDIYCRVSTTQQATEGYSIGEQQELLTAYANAQKWVINAVYTDAGYTGSNMDREGLKRLISDVQSQKVNMILVYKMDRLSRSQKEMLYLIEDIFQKNKCGFMSLTENFDINTPIGVATLGIMSAFSQMEKSNITQRMMMGRSAKIKQGYYHGSGVNNSPIGYTYSKADQKLIVDQYDAVMVRKIFEMYAQGLTMNQISKYLNLDVKWHSERKWSASHITRMLRNPVYIGKMRWNGETLDSNHDPIISEDLFNIVQSELSRRCGRTDRQQTPYAHTTLLGGLLWCDRCGIRYVAEKGRGWESNKNLHRYYCRNRLSHGRTIGVKCDNRGWRDDQLDYLIIDQIKKLSADRSMLDLESQKRSNHDADISAINARIADLDKQYDRTVTLFSMAGIDANAVQKRIGVIAAEKESLISELEKLKSETPPDIKVIRTKLDSFSDIVDTVSNRMELYTLVHQLINRIDLDGDQISIHWNLS